MDQLFLACDLECAAEQAARIEAGRYRTAGQRVLLISNNAPIPELTPGFDESDEFAAIAARFDRVVPLNSIIEPYHPLVWRPADRAWQQTFREALGLPGAFGLTLSAPAEAPDAVLAELFPDAPIEGVSAPAGPPSAGPVAAALGRAGRLARHVAGRLGRGVYWLRTLTFRPRN